MKKLIVMALALAVLSGCATSKLATDIGVNIGDSYVESAEKGTVGAEQSIKAWPYIHGLLKGVMASNYNFEMPVIAQEIIADLNKLAEKEMLTNEDKGFVIGSFCRLEAIALEYSWDNIKHRRS